MPIDAESTTWPRWVYAPLRALALISFAPSAYWLLYYSYNHRFIFLSESFILSFVISPLVVAAVNWPFVRLFFCTLEHARKEHSAGRFVRTAMRYSLAAMVATNILLATLFFFRPDQAADHDTPTKNVVGWLIVAPFAPICTACL
jgi:hypothetical protein